MMQIDPQMAAKASTGVMDQLLSLGLPGVIIIVLGFVVWKLFSKNNDIQEKRIDEAKQTTAALVSNSSALEKLSDALNIRKDA